MRTVVTCKACGEVLDNYVWTAKGEMTYHIALLPHWCDAKGNTMHQVSTPGTAPIVDKPYA